MEEGKLNWNLSEADLHALSELYMKEKRSVYDKIALVGAEHVRYSNTLGEIVDCNLEPVSSRHANYPDLY